MLSLSDPSRPLYFVEGVSPVLVLGQVPGYKAVLLTASDFTHVALIEVGIESLGVGPLSCPQVELSLTIQDAVATESTLFIRQNQLVYQFIGNYSLLPLTPPPSVYWQRVLQWVCVSRLVPVPMSHDGKEYFFILADGLQRGHTYRAEIADGVVTFKELLDEDGKNTCQHLNSDCQVLWVAHDPVYSKSDILLVEVLPEKGLDHAYVLLGLCLYFTELSPLPRFLPKEDSSGGFVILTGSEHYSSTPLLLRGIEINPFTWTLFLWGNAVLCSNDMGNHYMFFTGFPEDQLIKYFTMSRTGEFAFVTEFEQVWWGQEGVSSLMRVRPSTGWNTFSILQVLSGRESYQLPHSLVSVYYDADKLLQELVYTVDAAGRGSLLKRLLPVPEILSYQHFSEMPYSTKHTEASSEFVFPQPCPFFSMRVEEVPPPEPYSRVQHYQAKPATVLHPPGLQRPTSLAVYQGMLYQLLWLQSSYNRPYGDPVYDTTESWWKNKAMYKDYYFYLASNRLSSDGLYLSMEDYNKVYSSPGALQLPDCIYLDRGGSYNFSLFLTANTTDSLSDVSSRQDLLRQVWLAASVSNGNFIQVKTQRYEVISRGGLLYKVELKDLCLFPGQASSGQGLLSFNMLLRIVHSELQCYEQTESGISFKGESRVPVYVGCPPGQQLVFDITSTLAYAMQLNNQYFDCAKPDPKMPCFYYEDIFYPFFLIQDMVTGESRRFLGGYTLKVVGGGPYSQDNLRLYTEEEVLRYNSQNYSSFPSLVWMMVDDSGQPFNNTEDGFPILQGTVSISWICESNSPCADVLAVNLTSPEFFFLVEASNRGVDMSTYCDYTLQFMIHVHGLPLAPERGLSYMLVSLNCPQHTPLAFSVSLLPSVPFSTGLLPMVIRSF
ncbi:CTSRG protein, partial [Amia calva]|nr:CTSRG protein [Amia calva]